MHKTILMLVLLLAACGEKHSGVYQGYVEGEAIRIASPRAGRLDVLNVQRGQAVKAGERLFALEAGVEQAALAEMQARLADLGKGERPEEEEVRRAQLAEAQAQAALSRKEWQRQERLYADRVVSRERLDQAATNRDRDAARVRELQARLRAGALAGREDARRAAEAAVVQAQWQLDQKSQAATAGGRIEEVYFRAGEWVPAGAPVLALLPPQDRKLRFFVPQSALAGIRRGSQVQASCDGCDKPILATVIRVADTAEFTPPVIYSREQRSRMVFLVEASPAPEDAVRLQPGQPMDIELLR